MTKQECAIVTAYTEISMLRDFAHIAARKWKEMQKMPEMIDKQKVQAEVNLIAKHFAESVAQKAIIGRIQYVIDKMQTIEPEVRHGRWIKIEPNGLQSRWKCSECDGIVHAVTDFCPYCGGKNVGRGEAHNMSDQIKLEITFTSGETITYQPEQWDDYAYDGKAVIVKLRSAWVGIYNFDSVFCVELKPV